MMMMMIILLTHCLLCVQKLTDLISESVSHDLFLQYSPEVCCVCDTFNVVSVNTVSARKPGIVGRSEE